MKQSILILSLLVMSGCGSTTLIITPQPSPTPEPTSTPTPTPTPTVTPSPSPTPIVCAPLNGTIWDIDQPLNLGSDDSVVGTFNNVTDKFIQSEVVSPYRVCERHFSEGIPVSGSSDTYDFNYPNPTADCSLLMYSRFTYVLGCNTMTVYTRDTAGHTYQTKTYHTR